MTDKFFRFLIKLYCKQKNKQYKNLLDIVNIYIFRFEQINECNVFTVGIFLVSKDTFLENASILNFENGFW